MLFVPFKYSYQEQLYSYVNQTQKQGFYIWQTVPQKGPNPNAAWYLSVFHNSEQLSIGSRIKSYNHYSFVPEPDLRQIQK